MMSFLQVNSISALSRYFDGKALVALVAGALVGGFAKYMFDEWSARKKARRDLVANVTQNIEVLAKRYYWLLANNASTLTTLFEEYLRRRTGLQLSQEPPEKVKGELDELIDDFAEESFPYYAEFTKLTYEFNWRAGNTFFLRHYWAGRTIMNLHNEIRAAFEGVEDDNIIKTMIEASKDGTTRRKLHLADYKKLFPQDSDEHKSYCVFISSADRVSAAVQSLSAYNNLFHYELGYLYRDWFKNRFGLIRRRTPRFFLPAPLTQQARLTILDVAHRHESQPYAIAPLGMSRSRGRGPDSQPQHELETQPQDAPTGPASRPTSGSSGPKEGVQMSAKNGAKTDS